MFNNFQERMNLGGLTDIQRAAMFYVCIKISFGADVRSYGCGNRNIAADSFNDVAKRLERVTVENKDFEKLIKQYDRPGALIYCDPPYHSTERHYAEKFSEADHLRLCGTLKGVKGRFVLSYNDDGFVRNLYKDFEIIEVRRQNNLSSGSFKELIIKNF
jgi:DNA adenine methylase